MLELENLKKSFDKKLVLNNINLKIRNREIVSVFGPPGSGKSTLLNLIQGADYRGLRPDPFRRQRYYERRPGRTAGEHCFQGF